MNTKKGFILMTTLFLSFVLLAVVIVLTKDAFFQMSSSVAFNSRNEALMIAESGAHKAICYLENTVDPNTGKEPTQLDWNNEMSGKSIGAGKFSVNAWNNLAGTDPNGSYVNGLADKSSMKIPAGCILVKSVGKTKNGYTKTVTTLLTYQAISQMLYSGGNVRFGGDSNLSVKLDSLTGLQPRVHVDSNSSNSISIDSAISLEAKGAGFSTAAYPLDETSKNKITSSGGTVAENNQNKKDYHVNILKTILNKPPADAYEFGSELAKINSSGELDKTLTKLKFANSPVGAIYSAITGESADDYIEMDIDINKVVSVSDVKFTGTLKGDGDGNIWSSTSINVYYGEGKTDPDPNNPVTIWLSTGDGFNDCTTDGLRWDGASNKLIIEKGKYVSKDSDTCLGSLKLQDISLEISDDSELYINKQLSLANVDVTCGDGVKIVSGNSITLVDSAFEIGRDDDDDTNKVDIMTNGYFISVMNRNPSGGKNYIKGSIYADKGLIVNGSDGASLDIEGVLMTNGNLSIYNNLLTPAASNDFSCAFHYNPYMAGQYLQFNINKEDLQLQPLFWEVK
ncbi:MAG: hypothetical protein ABRQ38_29695 [Candidatus Eremiobacterota bacterium]